MALRLLLSLGVFALYLGFCGVFGSLLRSARRGSATARAQFAICAGLVLAPATAFVLGQAEISLSIRLATFLSGAGVAIASYRQPSWAPVRLWDISFTRVYFAAAMGITALWELASALTHASLAAPLLAAAAGLAGAASLSAARKAP